MSIAADHFFRPKIFATNITAVKRRGHHLRATVTIFMKFAGTVAELSLAADELAKIDGRH